MAKNLPIMQKTQVQSLGREDPLEKKIATHSSILAHRIPWIEESDGLQSTESQRVGHDRATNTHRENSVQFMVVIIVNLSLLCCITNLGW